MGEKGGESGNKMSCRYFCVRIVEKCISERERNKEEMVGQKYIKYTA